LPTTDHLATFLFKWAQHIYMHKWCNMPGRYVHCSSERKHMLCSKMLVAHVPHPNNLVYLPLLNSPTVLTLMVHM
jgi:hypothetical protein